MIITYKTLTVVRAILWALANAASIICGIFIGKNLVVMLNELDKANRLNWGNVVVYAGVPILLIAGELIALLTVRTWDTWVANLSPVQIDVLIPHMKRQRRESMVLELIRKSGKKKGSLTSDEMDSLVKRIEMKEEGSNV